MRMKQSIGRVATLTLAAGAAVLPLTSAHATTVACGQVITTDVRLTADLNCSGSALTIEASGVTVDLAGHSITGDGSGEAIEISGPNRDSMLIETAVRNGTISNFETGVAISLAQTVRLSRLHFDQIGSSIAPTSGALAWASAPGTSGSTAACWRTAAAPTP